MPRGICVYTGCCTPHDARGLCRTHYSQYRVGVIDVYGCEIEGPKKPRRKKGKPCICDGCRDRGDETGMCVRHRRHLDAGWIDKGGKVKKGPKRSGHGRLVIKKPFWYTAARGRDFVPLYRVVMFKHLGRCLESNESVEFLDGNKDNVRIANMRILFKSAPRFEKRPQLNDEYKYGRLEEADDDIFSAHLSKDDLSRLL